MNSTLNSSTDSRVGVRELMDVLQRQLQDAVELQREEREREQASAALQSQLDAQYRRLVEAKQRRLRDAPPPPPPPAPHHTNHTFEAPITASVFIDHIDTSSIPLPLLRRAERRQPQTAEPLPGMVTPRRPEDHAVVQPSFPLPSPGFVGSLYEQETSSEGDALVLRVLEQHDRMGRVVRASVVASVVCLAYGSCCHSTAAVRVWQQHPHQRRGPSSDRSQSSQTTHPSPLRREVVPHPHLRGRSASEPGSLSPVLTGRRVTILSGDYSGCLGVVEGSDSGGFTVVRLDTEDGVVVEHPDNVAIYVGGDSTTTSPRPQNSSVWTPASVPKNLASLLDSGESKRDGSPQGMTPNGPEVQSLRWDEEDVDRTEFVTMFNGANDGHPSVVPEASPQSVHQSVYARSRLSPVREPRMTRAAALRAKSGAERKRRNHKPHHISPGRTHKELLQDHRFYRSASPEVVQEADDGSVAASSPPRPHRAPQCHPFFVPESPSPKRSVTLQPSLSKVPTTTTTITTHSSTSRWTTGSVLIMKDAKKMLDDDDGDEVIIQGEALHEAPSGEAGWRNETGLRARHFASSEMIGALGTPVAADRYSPERMHPRDAAPQTSVVSVSVSGEHGGGVPHHLPQPQPHQPQQPQQPLQIQVEANRNPTPTAVPSTHIAVAQAQRIAQHETPHTRDTTTSRAKRPSDTHFPPGGGDVNVTTDSVLAPSTPFSCPATSSPVSRGKGPTTRDEEYFATPGQEQYRNHNHNLSHDSGPSPSLGTLLRGAERAEREDRSEGEQWNNNHIENTTQNTTTSTDADILRQVHNIILDAGRLQDQSPPSLASPLPSPLRISEIPQNPHTTTAVTISTNTPFHGMPQDASVSHETSTLRGTTQHSSVGVGTVAVVDETVNEGAAEADALTDEEEEVPSVSSSEDSNPSASLLLLESAERGAAAAEEILCRDNLSEFARFFVGAPPTPPRRIFAEPQKTLHLSSTDALIGLEQTHRRQFCARESSIFATISQNSVSDRQLIIEVVCQERRTRVSLVKGEEETRKGWEFGRRREGERISRVSGGGARRADALLLDHQKQFVVIAEQAARHAVRREQLDARTELKKRHQRATPHHHHPHPAASPTPSSAWLPRTSTTSYATSPSVRRSTTVSHPRGFSEGPGMLLNERLSLREGGGGGGGGVGEPQQVRLLSAGRRSQSTAEASFSPPARMGHVVVPMGGGGGGGVGRLSQSTKPTEFVTEAGVIAPYGISEHDAGSVRSERSERSESPLGGGGGHTPKQKGRFVGPSMFKLSREQLGLDSDEDDDEGDGMVVGGETLDTSEVGLMSVLLSPKKARESNATTEAPLSLPILLEAENARLKDALRQKEVEVEKLQRQSSGEHTDTVTASAPPARRSLQAERLKRQRLVQQQHHAAGPSIATQEAHKRQEQAEEDEAVLKASLQKQKEASEKQAAELEAKAQRKRLEEEAEEEEREKQKSLNEALRAKRAKEEETKARMQKEAEEEEKEKESLRQKKAEEERAAQQREKERQEKEAEEEAALQAEEERKEELRREEERRVEAEAAEKAEKAEKAERLRKEQEETQRKRSEEAEAETQAAKQKAKDAEDKASEERAEKKRAEQREQEENDRKSSAEQARKAAAEEREEQRRVAELQRKEEATARLQAAAEADAKRREEALERRKQEDEDSTNQTSITTMSTATSNAGTTSGVSAKWSNSKQKYYFCKDRKTFWTFPADTPPGDLVSYVGGPEAGSKHPATKFLPPDVVAAYEASLKEKADKEKEKEKEKDKAASVLSSDGAMSSIASSMSLHSAGGIGQPGRRPVVKPQPKQPQQPAVVKPAAKVTKPPPKRILLADSSSDEDEGVGGAGGKDDDTDLDDSSSGSADVVRVVRRRQVSVSSSESSGSDGVAPVRARRRASSSSSSSSGSSISLVSG